MSQEHGYLALVNICDNFRLASSPELYRWSLPSDLPHSTTPSVVGLLMPEIVELLEADNATNRSQDLPESWQILASEAQPGLEGRSPRRAVSFAPHLKTPSARSRVMKALCERWRDSGLFPDVIGPKKWRAESYPVYHDPFGAHLNVNRAIRAGDADDEDSAARECSNYAFAMERSACALFGVVTYGVHMTMYHPQSEESGVRIWVPRRASTKSTWPSYLDNTIAGGIPAGYGAFESMVKECMEEGNLAEWVVRKHAHAVGSISYFFQTGIGWLQPEVEYVYDLRISPNLTEDESAAFVPRPLDGEVEAFELLPLPAVLSKLRAAEFKPNCGLVIIDFLIRHGYLTPDDEPDYMQLITRLHGRFEYENW